MNESSYYLLASNVEQIATWQLTDTLGMQNYYTFRYAALITYLQSHFTCKVDEGTIVPHVW